MNHQFKPDDPKDVRVSVTTRIWIFATAMIMMAISTLNSATSASLAGLSHVIIDLAILAGAGFSTAAVWGAFDSRSRGVLPPPAGNTNDIKRLEERLANLEMISAYERLMQSEKEKPGAIQPTEQADQPVRKVKLSLR
jgi:hypothetical protein